MPGTRRGGGVRRYGRDAYGDRSRNACRCAVRPDRRTVRFLSLPRTRARGPRAAPLPAMSGGGYRALSAGTSSLPRRYCARRGRGRRAEARRVTSPAEERLVTLIAESVRGPQREGLFALWLVVRAAEALLPPAPVSAKNHPRRLQALESRLGSPALPAPLKRALVAARQHLRTSTPDPAAPLLSQLAAPARDV